MVKYKVYKITNTINGKVYVGITQLPYLSQRLWYHANRERSSGAYLHWSIKKHGVENFHIELLHAYDTPEQAKSKERELIEMWCLNRHRHPEGIGMNLTDGGDGSYGLKHRVESIAKMSGKNNHNFGLFGADNPTSKPITMCSMDDIPLQTFGSVREAARFIKPELDGGYADARLKSVVTNIIQATKQGRSKSAYGYRWRY